MELDAVTLSRLDPGVDVPEYNRSALRGGIVHVGVGNFVRVHLAAYIDACLHLPDTSAWGMVGVGLGDGPEARAKAAAFKAQDCLYGLTTFSAEGRGRTRIIGAMIDYLHAPADPEAVLDRLSHADTKVVTLTITEGGYNIDEASGRFRLDTPAVADDLRGGPPKTVFGYLVGALARRRAAGLPAFTIASLDNLRGSGDTTRTAILGFATKRDAALGVWIAENVDFPNSMVDRLAPQVPEAERARLNTASGIADRLPVPTEAFSQWVVEDRFRQGRPPFEQVGVEFRDDVAEWLAFKGRLVNASHVLLSYPGLLLGHRIVSDALTNPLLVAYVESFMTHDAKPNVRGPAGLSVDAYAAKFVPRFANPAIADQLLRVAGDGIAKLPTFHGQTIRALLDGKTDLRREAFLFACFGRYLRFIFDANVRDDRGARFEPYEPGLSEADRIRLRAGGPEVVLSLDAFSPLGLAAHEEFRSYYDRYSASLAESGAAETLKDLLG